MTKQRMVVILAVATAVLVSLGALRADSDDAQTLHGSFIATVQTPTRTLKATYTFSPGGGVVETNLNPAGATVVSHGSWVRTGERQFVFVLWFLGQTPADPNSSFVRQKARELITLDPSGNSYTSAIQLSLFDANGNLIGSPQGSALATRITTD